MAGLKREGQGSRIGSWPPERLYQGRHLRGLGAVAPQGKRKKKKEKKEKREKRKKERKKEGNYMNNIK